MIINPIPKSSSTDPKDPLSYRGIALASAMYKIYCNVLNSRLSKWVEENDKLVDEQNGFRKKRSTTDHILSLCNIIETRKKMKKSTFCAFIDFKKAYDSINRNILWQRLRDSGIGGRMLIAIKALYNSVSSCVRVNYFTTDWFDVKVGLRQGCILSPILFNLYINDLALYLKSLNTGINVGQEKVCILLYADDIVLLADSAKDLQTLLNAVKDWCLENHMAINCSKSNVIHFRNPSKDKTNIVFKCGDDIIQVVDRYTYLGLVLTEYLDFNVTAKVVAQSASRALGLVIAKCKLAGGVPYSVFTKLYDSVVWPVISYGAAIWGCRSFSCINAVHNRAMRFFLGVGKYTPSAALVGEMAWHPPIVRQWKHIMQLWARVSNTLSLRINKRIALWASAASGPPCKNWFFMVKTKLGECNTNSYTNIGVRIPKKHICTVVENYMMSQFIDDWKSTITSFNGPSGRGRNKLRTYCTFKSEFSVEFYCKMILPLKHRAAFCKFRCGVAPIRLETGRYENLPENERKCIFCNEVESEQHVILHCPLYDDIRDILFEKATHVSSDFTSLSDTDKLIFLFTDHSLIRVCAKTCFKILNRRSSFLCK